MRTLGRISTWSAGLLAVALVGSCGYNIGNGVNQSVELFVQADNARQVFADAVKNGVRGERPVDTLLPAWQKKLATAVASLSELADAWEAADDKNKTQYDSKINIELKGYLDMLFAMGMTTTLKVPTWNVANTNLSFQAYAQDMVLKINTDLDRVVIYYKRLYKGQAAPTGDFSLSTVVDNCLVDTRQACMNFYKEISDRAAENTSYGPLFCKEYGIAKCEHQMNIDKLRADYANKSVCGKGVQGTRCIRSHTNTNTTHEVDGGTTVTSETICDEYEIVAVPADWLEGSVESHRSDSVVVIAGCQ